MEVSSRDVVGAAALALVLVVLVVLVVASALPS